MASPTRVLDADAAASYRAHLHRLDRLLEEADETGDAAASERLTAERDAVLAQLRRDTGLAGRVRQTSNEAERARVNTTRTLRAALHTIALVAPKAGAHLTASLRTGHFCRYEPAAGRPGLAGRSDAGRPRTPRSPRLNATRAGRRMRATRALDPARTGRRP